MSTTALDRSARDLAADVPSPGLAARYYTDSRVAEIEKDTPGWGPGPLSRREAGVSWFADHIRHDVDPHLTLGAQEA